MKPDYEKEYLSGQDLVATICEGDENTFKVLFFKYFHDLCSFAAQITRSHQQGKYRVQEAITNNFILLTKISSEYYKWIILFKQL